jgi:hypothetical protein
MANSSFDIKKVNNHTKKKPTSYKCFCNFVRLRFMDSNYLFGIFKLVLHMKSKELLSKA